jgi:hypothetical protein
MQLASSYGEILIEKDCGIQKEQITEESAQKQSSSMDSESFLIAYRYRANGYPQNSSGDGGDRTYGYQIRIYDSYQFVIEKSGSNVGKFLLADEP